MRPRNQMARDQLAAVLRRRAAISASDLARQLGVSIPSLHRLLKELGDSVVVTGKARRTRYALRRPLRGDLASLPLYAVDEAGRAERIAQLALIHPAGTWMPLTDAGWPVPEESRDGWWSGLPYPLYDMQPQGFMGRQFARAEHGQFAVAANPKEWSDDDILHVLNRRGVDLSGNLILGDPACEHWQRSKLEPPVPLKMRALGKAYAGLAEQAIAAGVPGSRVAGEFPKFTALREAVVSGTSHVLVKFSGADGSPAVQRWADLLVSEHLALQCAATLPGIESARSRIVIHAGRTFLEVERFDRHGLFGRSRLSTLATLDAALLGDGSTDWTRLASRLAAAGLLAPEQVQRIEHLWWFGRLIANTDMHTANLSFRAHATLALAPAYDMLPMLYAPLPGGEVPIRRFEPPMPLPPQRPAWLAAGAAALSFWKLAAADSRISDRFRRICAANAQRLHQVAEQV
jgi:AraC-like DNA-binding protein